jgi:hypothetical protein
VSIEDDALKLVAWFEDQPNLATDLSDRYIAVQLDWFVGGTAAPRNKHRHWRKDYGGPDPDLARVRRARRYVDRDKEGLFADYTFGPRTKGGGVNYQRLTRRSDFAEGGFEDELIEAAREAVQSDAMVEAERWRRIEGWQARLAEATAKGQIIHALCCQQAVNDYKGTGVLQANTKQMLVDAGLMDL